MAWIVVFLVIIFLLNIFSVFLYLVLYKKAKLRQRNISLSIKECLVRLDQLHIRLDKATGKFDVHE